MQNILASNFIRCRSFKLVYNINIIKPIDVMEEGIVTVPREVEIALPIPLVIWNMAGPININPLTKVTSVRDEQAWNALSPKKIAILRI